MTSFPWLPAGATGVGSLPGGDTREASRIVTGELAGFLHLPELPNRGPGSDMIGRTGALLALVGGDFGLETTPDGWRVTAGRGRAMRRALSWLDEDLDRLEESSDGYEGPLKVQIVGPWTMAAAIELPFGERMVKDPGACRDLAEGLAEAARLHLIDLRRRFPRAALVVQWDEPGITAVLEGSIGTASGMSRYAAIDGPIAEAGLRVILSATTTAGALPGIHCCATRPPIELFASSGAGFIGIDMLDGQFDYDALGTVWEAGIGILAGSVRSSGTVPSTADARLSDTEASRPVRLAASRLGLTDPQYLAGVVVTPTCGLAAASPAWARAAYSACNAAGRVLRGDDLEEDSGR